MTCQNVLVHVGSPISRVYQRGVKEEMGRKYIEPPKYPVVYEYPKVSAVVANFSLRDMMTIVTLTSASIPFGYLAGSSSNLRGSSMLVAGLTGLQTGYMLAYLYSKGRLQGMLPNDDEVARLGSIS